VLGALSSACKFAASHTFSFVSVCRCTGPTGAEWHQQRIRPCEGALQYCCHQALFSCMHAHARPAQLGRWQLNQHAATQPTAPVRLLQAY
jgi:hypothetical protein